MDLRRLRYFVAVAEERSVGRAAERLRMAQPPLSVQIRKLESEIGAPLFHRGTRGMELTEAGQALLSRASGALALAAEGAEAARAVAAGRRGRLSVGYMFVLAHAVLPKLVPELRRSLPGVELEFVELSGSTREARLLDRTVTAALCNACNSPSRNSSGPDRNAALDARRASPFAARPLNRRACEQVAGASAYCPT